MPETFWQVLNMKFMQWPETEIGVTIDDLSNWKTRDIGQTIFSTYAWTGELVWQVLNMKHLHYVRIHNEHAHKVCKKKSHMCNVYEDGAWRVPGYFRQDIYSNS